MFWLWNKPLNPKQRRRVEEVISRGKAFFVLRYGLLQWSLPILLGITTWDYFDGTMARRTLNLNLIALLGHVVIFAAGGFWLGISLWRRCHSLLHP